MHEHLPRTQCAMGSNPTQGGQVSSLKVKHMSSARDVFCLIEKSVCTIRNKKTTCTCTLFMPPHSHCTDNSCVCTYM